MLAAKPNATFEDAVRAFHELVTEQPAAEDATFETLAAALVERKVIRSDWTATPQAKLTRGRAAYMICQRLRHQGRLTMRVFGPSEAIAVSVRRVALGGATGRPGRRLMAVLAGGLGKLDGDEKILRRTSERWLYRYLLPARRKPSTCSRDAKGH